MPELSRVIDKYTGQAFCDLAPEDQKEYLGALAQRGGLEALKALGIDEDGVNDIRDLRDILKGFRVIRKTAITTTLATIGRVAGWVCILLLAGFFLHTSPVAKKAVVDLMAP